MIVSKCLIPLFCSFLGGAGGKGCFGFVWDFLDVVVLTLFWVFLKTVVDLCSFGVQPMEGGVSLLYKKSLYQS